ncbi:FAD-dependent oxidoreductase [Rhodococcus sp. NPDC057014]|uniref:FAD-dependent oxidoreductase n=1 Tax=Rhodococcus sp. NPDC057014 TaxID=3346000 RepID=UPI003634C32A
MPEITIVGAGICGLTLAIAAVGHGHRVTVYERREPEPAGEDGAYLTVSGQALADLDTLDVGVTLRATGVPVHTISMTTDGRSRRAPLTPVDGIGHHHFWRRDLIGALRRRCRELGATIIHGATATAVDTSPDDARLHLADGRIVTSDVLVGCDGISSIVRGEIIAGPTRPVYDDQVVLYGHHARIPGHAHPGPGELSFFRHAEHTFGILDGGDTGIFWFARLTRPELPPAGVGLHSSQDWARELTAAFPTPAPDVRRHLAPTPTIFACNAERVPDLSSWGDRRAVIIGDAAHGMSPAAGQGASLAIADALGIAAVLDPRTPGSEFSSAIDRRRTATDDARNTPARRPQD